MNGLKKKHIQAIQRVLQQGKTSVKISTLWEHICNTQGVGEVVANQYLFSSKDLSLLGKVLDGLSTESVMHAKLSGERVGMAGKFVDEKFADENVFEGYFHAYRADQKPLTLKSGVVQSPEGVSLFVHIDEIDIDKCPVIVVVENGKAFLQWHRFNLKAKLEGALIVYRGHGKDQSTVFELVRRLQAVSKEVIGFFDYDPAGIQMAMNLGVNNVIVPIYWDKHSSELPVGAEFNNEVKYLSQVDLARKYLNGQPPGSAKVLRSVVDGKWGYQQEHLIAHQVPLCRVAVL